MTKWDLEYDFVSIGGGIGGITAALVAHDAGLKPIVLEKSSTIGGVAALSSGQFWVAGNYLEKEAGIEDSWERGQEYLESFTYDQDPAMLRKFCVNAPRAFEYLGKDAGVQWRIHRFPDNAWPELPGSVERGRLVELEPFDAKTLEEPWRSIARFSPTSWFSNEEMYFEMGGHAHRQDWDWDRANARKEADIRLQGSALSSFLAVALAKREVPVFVNVEVLELVVENGHVEGVVAVIDGETKTIRGRKGTLIATGGYDWNSELVERFDGHKGAGSRANEEVTGDHFALVEPLGVQLGAVTRTNGYGFAETPAEEKKTGWQPVQAPFQPFYSGWPHAINVDRHGKRFSDESGGGRRHLSETVRARGKAEFVNVWAIFDSQYRDKYPIGKTGPGEPLPAPFVSAETLPELARLIGIDAATLEETVAQFNRAAEAGKDPEFGRGSCPWAGLNFGDPLNKPNTTLGTIEKPPFFSIKLEIVGVGNSQVGLKTDDRGRVLNADGPIPGLYAAGNAMAWSDLGCIYHSGSANTRGMTWGYIAAHDAAGVPLAS